MRQKEGQACSAPLERKRAGNIRKRVKKIKRIAITVIAFIIVTGIIRMLGLSAAEKVRMKWDDMVYSIRHVNIGTYSKGASSVVGYTQTSEAAVLDGTFELDEKTREISHLKNASMKDLVALTLEPFGRSEDKPFKDVVFSLEYKELHRFFPTEEEIAVYKDSLIAEELEKKEGVDKELKRTDGREGVKGHGVNSPKGEVDIKEDIVRLEDDEGVTIYPSTPSDFKIKGNLTPEELLDIGARVQVWIEENTHEEEVFVVHDFVLSGEQQRLFRNSFHTPWQANYVLADYIEAYNDRRNNEVNEVDYDIEITTMALDRVKSLYNSILVNLMLDYWEMDEDGNDNDDIHIAVSYEEYAGKLTSAKGDNCYEEWDNQYYDAPIKVADGEECLEQWGYKPLVFVDSVVDWALKKEYSTELASVSELTQTPWGYLPQKEIKSEMSVIFKRAKALYDISTSDIYYMGDMLKELPEGKKHSERLMAAAEFASRASCDGKVVDPATLEWLSELTGDEAFIVQTALSRLGDMYSMDLRDVEGYADCSSFAHWVYKQLGIEIGWQGDYTAAGEAYACKRAGCEVDVVYDESTLQIGDLLFWDHSSRRDDDGAYKKIDHVGIYIGNGMIVDASSSWGCVVCREMWGEEQIVAVGRPLRGRWISR